jgi:UDP-2,3-diacylglucosamine pyrophosphatase LpxH
MITEESLVSISDIHIRDENDEAFQVFRDFTLHSLTQNATHICLAGDIFDVMAGSHEEYFQRYKIFFNQLTNWIKAGKRVYVFEGNHDVNLKKLYDKFRSTLPLSLQYKLSFNTQGLILNIGQKKVYVSHGDEYDIDNKEYISYKSMITSPLFQFLANSVIPLRFLDYYGKKASQASRNHGRKTFSEEDVRQKFRGGVQQLRGVYSVDVVIGGHSHVRDEYSFQTRWYLNNGYPLEDRTFINVCIESNRLIKF